MSEEKKPAVYTESRDGMFVIVLNRPEKKNALNLDMMQRLEAAADAAALDREGRIVVIRSEGNAFSAGIDLNVVAEIAGLGGHGRFRWAQGKMQAALNRIESIEKPVLCLIQGVCFGMGMELALAADFRVAESGATLALQETELGLVPDVGGTTRLTRLVGPNRAKEIIMLARRLTARQALEIQWVNEVVEEGGLEEAAKRWAVEARRAAPLAAGLAKRLINLGAGLDRNAFMELEGIAQASLLNTKDVREGVTAKMERREPEFKGE